VRSWKTERLDLERVAPLINHYQFGLS
jgi:hypothetical protein